MMNENIMKVLGNRADFYPHKLEQQFPQVLDKIIQIWDSPEFDYHLNKLMLDNREQRRQGFPPDVASEILRLSILHGDHHTNAEAKPWIDTSDIKID